MTRSRSLTKDKSLHFTARSYEKRYLNSSHIAVIIQHYAVATRSEPSKVLNWLNGQQSDMFSQMFIDFLSSFFRVSKLRDVEGFQEICLFLSLLNERPWIFFIRSL